MPTVEIYPKTDGSPELYRLLGERIQRWIDADHAGAESIAWYEDVAVAMLRDNGDCNHWPVVFEVRDGIYQPGGLVQLLRKFIPADAVEDVQVDERSWAGKGPERPRRLPGIDSDRRRYAWLLCLSQMAGLQCPYAHEGRLSNAERAEMDGLRNRLGFTESDDGEHGEVITDVILLTFASPGCQPRASVELAEPRVRHHWLVPVVEEMVAVKRETEAFTRRRWEEVARHTGGVPA